MKIARLLFALALVGGAAACSADNPTGLLPESPRTSVYVGGGNGTPTDSTQRTDPAKQPGS